MIRILFTLIFSLIAVRSQADVPPEVLRQELANEFSLDGLDELVPPGSAPYEAAVLDPWLGYRVIAVVDKSKAGSWPSAQTMSVFVYDGPGRPFKVLGIWNVSTGLETPRYNDGKLISERKTRVGFYRAEYLKIDYVSVSYGEAMPYSVFYDRDFGVAVHATSPNRYPLLGKRASMGCTRLTYENAKLFYETIVSFGYNTVVKLDWISGQVKNAAHGPLVVKSYPLLLINTEPGDPQAAVKMDPLLLQKHPEDLAQLIPKVTVPQTNPELGPDDLEDHSGWFH